MHLAKVAVSGCDACAVVLRCRAGGNGRKGECCGWLVELGGAASNAAGLGLMCAVPREKQEKKG